MANLAAINTTSRGLRKDLGCYLRPILLFKGL
jgi:hypothetical protein